jgi:hypothetical protein
VLHEHSTEPSYTFSGAPRRTPLPCWKRRNAITAVIHLFNNIERDPAAIFALKRVCVLITEGGLAAPCLPDRASPTFYIRYADHDVLAGRKLTDK